jgi:hypothetical protein
MKNQRVGRKAAVVAVLADRGDGEGGRGASSEVAEMCAFLTNTTKRSVVYYTVLIYVFLSSQPLTQNFIIFAFLKVIVCFF